ncbi:cell division protein SepF [Tepidibacter formicigenes]|jgi:cell division inhibitor SepF|uniref:Cell division protein SepF n=1 Tax=Tepidibacter formicigenes DSM 15518 TaxID=1123349 RepID=A0A1M6KEE5_9FIRM|nr:cell division protein SepF [Tepidibacter formicigenes]SHJ57282.1 cell division inhibitor SepF [Tepidibacter formicigenes DSM 15518]
MSDKFVDKVKKFMGFEEYEEEEYEEEEHEEEIIPFNQRTSSKINNKIVNIHATTQMKVMIHEPQEYDEAASIVDNLKNRKAVIVNLENIEDVELVKNIFHFISGAVYALDGSIQKVSKGIFILAPSNIDIDGNIKKELENKGLFPWQKEI